MPPLVFSSPSGPVGSIVLLDSPQGVIPSPVIDLAASVTSSVVSNLSALPGATVTDALNGVADLLDGDVYSFEDDFGGGISGGIGLFTVAAGAVMPTGQGNWFARSLGTAAGGQIGQGAAAVANHPGIVRLLTAATAINDAIFFHKGAFNNGTSAFLRPEDVALCRVVAMLPAVTTMRAWFGLGAALNSATFGAEAAAFSYDSVASPNWRALISRAGTQVFADTGVLAVAGDWRDFQISQPTPDKWEYRIDGALVASLTSPAGAIVGVNTGAFCQTLVAATRELQIDFFRLVSKTLNRSL